MGIEHMEFLHGMWNTLADHLEAVSNTPTRRSYDFNFMLPDSIDEGAIHSVLHRIADIGVTATLQVGEGLHDLSTIGLSWKGERKPKEVVFMLREKFPIEPAPQPGKLGQAIHTLAKAHTPQPRRNYVLWTGDWVGNDLLLWRKDHRGYTSNLNDAHRFTKEEAERQHKVRETDIPINLDLAAPGFITVINPEVMSGDDSDKLWEDINKYRR